jgi:REP element-mobilizing transposase RayT
MARPLRLEHPGAIWHVTSRGNERRAIVRSDADRRAFLEFLAEAVTLHRWILHAYVLMTNHYHLIVETPVPTLSRGVKRLNERYAETFNLCHHRVGHLVQGRFKGILVERESHLLELIRYVVLNPVRAGMVQHAGDYAWSSYRATAGLAPAPAWLEVDWTLDQFAMASGTLADKREQYRRFVSEGHGAAYNPWESLVGQLYLGGEQFCERMQALVASKPRSPEHPRSQRRFVRPSFDAVVDAVSRTFNEPADTIRRRSHAVSRKAVAHLAWEEAGVTLAATGAWLGVTGAAAGHLARESKRLEASDRIYAALLRAIRADLPGSPGVNGAEAE